jgi:CheY-like chemotaxis protein
MDIVMPEMNGIEATYEIRKLAPETRIVLISSSDGEDTSIGQNLPVPKERRTAWTYRRVPLKTW